MKSNKNPIFVTKPFLPPLEEFMPYLEEIWSSHILTNDGPFHKKLEDELCKYLGVKHISLFSNGTLALITALQSLKITGEVITTPFSFVATTHALLWNNIRPVFVDIEPGSCNIDPEKIESAITSQTTAILPVHVYGNPCNTDRIKEIAEKHNLKVIYDAAHTFGAKKNKTSIVNFGDLSILSFHATKVFNTFEGGAIVCHDQKTKNHIDELKNFGIIDETTVVTSGINAKMNEIQAAIGLLQLKYIDDSIEKRRLVTDMYRTNLSNVPGISIQQEQHDVSYNYAYFPIFINSQLYGKTRNEVYEELKNFNIFSRRYFYPLISQFPIYSGLESSFRGKLPVAEKITEEVLCLPIYPDLELARVDEICRIIKNVRR